jgi:hypothetical protein
VRIASVVSTFCDDASVRVGRDLLLSQDKPTQPFPRTSTANLLRANCLSCHHWKHSPTRQLQSFMLELIIQTPNVRPCMCAVPTFRYAFARSCYNCPSRTVGALNGTHRVQPKGKRMAFYFPFYPCNARLVKVELQVSAQGDAVKGPDVTVSCCIPAVGLWMITFMTLYFRL